MPRADAIPDLSSYGDVFYANTRFSVVGGTSRDISLTTDLAVSGVGFTPKAVLCFCGTQIDAVASWGFAMSTLVSDRALAQNAAGSVNGSPGNYLIDYTNGANTNRASVKSWDADGITLQWTKTNTPTGTFYLNFLFFR